MRHQKTGLMIITALCLSITRLYAQQSANAAGGDAIGVNGSTSYSIGQPVYTYDITSTGSSSQGVQQPYEFFTVNVGIDNYKLISLLITAFPNPAQSIINLKIENDRPENFSFLLYDAAGKTLLTQKVRGALTVVPIQQFADGAYLLQVNEGQKSVKAFKIIKK